MKEIKVLITGTGRCGTVYFANLLSSIGIPCGHEAIFTPDGLDEAINRLENPSLIKFSECTSKLPKWAESESIVADSSYMSAPFLSQDILSNTKIIHLVRHPIKVIRSFVNANYFNNNWPAHTVPYQKFIKDNIPHIYDNNLDNANRAALYYIEWNKLIEKNIINKEHIFHKIEDSDEIVCNFLNKKIANEKIDNKINSWVNTKEININQFDSKIKKDIKDIILKYNYNE